MLHSVSIISSSGIVIFEKIWAQGASSKSRLFGSLLSTMQEFSRQTTRMLVTYIEFNNLAISMVQSEKENLFCVLFHDVDDGAQLGKLVAEQILRSFVDLHRQAVHESVKNVAVFASFQAKLADALKGVFFVICTKLRSVRGINGVMLLQLDGEPITSGAWDDEFAIIANVQAMLSASHELMEIFDDNARLISFEYLKSSVLALETRQGTLLAFCRRSVKQSLLLERLHEAVMLLDKAANIVQGVSPSAL